VGKGTGTSEAMKYRFGPDALAELFDAIDYYNSREAGLGGRFAANVFAAVDAIVAHPYSHAVFDDDLRRVVLAQFPYSLLYTVDESCIVIVVVMHQRRRPDYWKGREQVS
jgi:plasmid stabilization system protein ParE